MSTTRLCGSRGGGSAFQPPSWAKPLLQSDPLPMGPDLPPPQRTWDQTESEILSPVNRQTCVKHYLPTTCFEDGNYAVWNQLCFADIFIFMDFSFNGGINLELMKNTDRLRIRGFTEVS